MLYLTYAQRGRTAGWRYLLTTALSLVFTVVLAGGIATLLFVTGVAPPDLAAKLQSPSEPVIFFGGIAVMFLCMSAGLLLAARWVQGKRLGDLIGAWRWRLVALGAAVWTAAIVVLTLIDVAIAPSGFSLTASAQTPLLALIALIALVPQTFTEELIFRGFLTQGLFLAIKRPLATAIVSGIIFGAVHIPNGTPQAVAATVFGVVTALLAIRFGGIAFPFGLHLANNSFSAIFVVSQGDVFKGLPGVFAQATPQLMWFDVATASIGLIIVAALAARRLIPGQSVSEQPS